MQVDRQVLLEGRQGQALTHLGREAHRILSSLERDGAVRVDPPALLPSDLLLDLYGEDIRARAFLVEDASLEWMLRPDFTVPVARMQIAQGSTTGRYSYCGSVWRRQSPGSGRPREYLQAGIEVFGGQAKAREDAALLRLVLDAVDVAPVQIVAGDLGLLIAAVDGLDTSAARQAALRRHIWRPRRFQELLGRYGRDHDALAERRKHVTNLSDRDAVGAAAAAAGEQIGKRKLDEIAARIGRLRDEADAAPMSDAVVRALERLISLRGRLSDVTADLRELQVVLPGLAPAVDRFEERLNALSSVGLDPGGIGFEVSFGRNTMEYYDGFVFAALAPARNDLPPLAAGGRYDTLMQLLGAGGPVPALGAIVRPEAVVEASQ